VRFGFESVVRVPIGIAHDVLVGARVRAGERKSKCKGRQSKPVPMMH
jgi:hypothetical protein